MEIQIVTDVATEPNSLLVVKDFLRIDQDYTMEDATVTMLNKAARELLERHLNLSLGVKTVDILTRRNRLELPYGPHISIESVKDADGNVISPNDYTESGLQFKTLDFGTSRREHFYSLHTGCVRTWSRTPLDSRERIIRAQVGYNPTNIPNGLRTLILRLTDYMWLNRGSVVSQLPPDIREAAQAFSRNSIL